MVGTSINSAPSPISTSSNTTNSTITSNAVPRVGGVRCYWALLKPRFPTTSNDNNPNSTNPQLQQRQHTQALAGPSNNPGLSQFELTFLHLDPVLSVHMAKQKMTLMGRGVLEFIHPAERDQARRDLANAIAADDLQGSVTRVRFARLSRIRQILGGAKDEIDIPSDAASFVEDEEYLILDLVLNWVADGLLLAFFHAIRDKDPAANNDPSKKHEEWTNYCGTANMGDDQIESLGQSVSTGIPPHIPTRYPPTRVFQIHSSPTPTNISSSLMFTWPPPRQLGSFGRFDGLYDALDYSDLMKGVDMDGSQLKNSDATTNCTTRFGATHSVRTEGVYRVIASVFIPYGSLIFACFQTIKLVDPTPTTRSSMTVPSTSVASGSGMGQSSNQGPNPMQVVSAPTNPSSSSIIVPENYTLMTPQQDWISQSQEWHRPTPPSDAEYSRAQKRFREDFEYDDGFRSGSQPQPQQRGSQHMQSQPHIFPPASISQDQHETPHSQQTPSQSYPPSGPSIHSYLQNQPANLQTPISHQPPPPFTPQSAGSITQQQQHSSHPQHAPPQIQMTYPEIPFTPATPQHLQPQSSQSQPLPQAPHHVLPVLPHPQPFVTPVSLPLPNPSHTQSLPQHASQNYISHISPGGDSNPEQMQIPPNHLQQGNSNGNGNSNTNGNGNGNSHSNVPGHTSRPLVPPPGDVECCVICGIKESPEWRRNESGLKDLCNACGLRLSRQVAKREGRQKPRKKK